MGVGKSREDAVTVTDWFNSEVAEVGSGRGNGYVESGGVKELGVGKDALPAGGSNRIAEFWAIEGAGGENPAGRAVRREYRVEGVADFGSGK